MNTLPNKTLLNLTKYTGGKLQNSDERYKDEWNKWRDSAYLWIGRVNIVKMSLLILIYGFNTILAPSKLLYGYWQTDYKMSMGKQDIGLVNNTEEQSQKTDTTWLQDCL